MKNKMLVIVVLSLCLAGLVACGDKKVIKEPIQAVTEYTDGMSQTDFANYYATLLLSGQYERIWELTQVEPDIFINKEAFLEQCYAYGVPLVEPQEYPGTSIKIKTSEGKKEVTAMDLIQIYGVENTSGMYNVQYGVDNDNTVDGLITVGVTRAPEGGLAYKVPEAFYNVAELKIKIPRNAAIQINGVDIPTTVVDIENVYTVKKYAKAKSAVDTLTMVTALGEKTVELSTGLVEFNEEDLGEGEVVVNNYYEFDWDISKVEFEEIEKWLGSNTQNVFDAVLSGNGLETNFNDTLSNKANKEEVKPSYLRVVDAFRDTGSYKAKDLKCVDIKLLTSEERDVLSVTNKMLDRDTLEVQVRVRYSYIKEGFGTRNIYDEVYETSVHITKDDEKYKFIGFGEKFFSNIY